MGIVAQHAPSNAPGRSSDTTLAKSKPSLPTAMLWLQGVYYLLTGVWPLIDIRSFQAVTGPKTDHLVTGLERDHWLVMTVGVLITGIALSLLSAAWRKSANPETVVLAMASALGLTAIDVIYVARGAILPIYLVDAALEIVLIAVWLFLLASGNIRRWQPSRAPG